MGDRGVRCAQSIGIALLILIGAAVVRGVTYGLTRMVMH